MNLSITDWYAYHIWANHRMISRLQALPTSILHMHVENVFPNLYLTLGHIYAVDQTWLLRIQGQSTGQIVPEVFDSLEIVQKCYQDISLEFKDALASSVSTSPDGGIITYRNTKGESFQNTIEEIVMHVVNHGTYHRGNLASIIRQLGYQGISTDYIVYLRESAKL